MMRPSDKIVIVGGGIAGLSAALALAQAGWPVVVYEKVITLREIGAGLQLGPNATRWLRHWGVLDALLLYSSAPQFIHLNDGKSGKTLTSLPVAHFSEYHWHAPYLTVHRADLYQILAQAALKQPRVQLHYGHEVQSVSGSFETGFEIDINHQGQIIRQRARLCVACDGVWSPLRQRSPLFEAARPSGLMAWRATLGRAQLPESFLSRDHDQIQVFMGAKRHLIAYPIKTGQEFNFVAITLKDKMATQHPLMSFERWTTSIRDVLSCAPQWTAWPLFVMNRLRFLDTGGVIYLGDSAHATTPFAAQGAATAIEDAGALAHGLSLNMPLKQALQIFARARTARMRRIIRRGHVNRFVYHAWGPLAHARNIVMTQRQGQKFLADLDWLYREQS